MAMSGHRKDIEWFIYRKTQSMDEVLTHLLFLPLGFIEQADFSEGDERYALDEETK